MTRMTPLLERNEQFARTYTPVALGAARRPGGPRDLPGPPGRPGRHPRAPARRRSRPAQRGRTGHPGRHRRPGLPGLPRRPAVRRPARAGPAVRGRGHPPHPVRHQLPGRPRLPAPGRRGDRPWPRRRWRPPRWPTRTPRSRPTWSCLLASPRLSPKVSVSGHVYDIDTGRVTTIVDARYPDRALSG